MARRSPRRFVLADLEPATRKLFRDYAAGSRACSQAYEQAGKAQRMEAFLADMVRRIEGDGRVPDRSTLDRLAAARQRHAELSEQAEAAERRATAAREAAQPALEDAGYPWSWWWSGTMRIPAGEEPTPRWTDADRNRYRHHHRADCPSWPDGCGRCRR